MPAAADMARWLIFVLLATILLVASASDIRNRRIPNWTILAIAILFVPWALLGPRTAIFPALGAALIAFLISCPMYVFRVLGAGDSKLLTVVTLFVGLAQLIHFLLFVVLAGGVIAVGSILLFPTRALVKFQMRRIEGGDRGIPYGVAIAIGAICVIAWPLARHAMG